MCGCLDLVAIAMSSAYSAMSVSCPLGTSLMYFVNSYGQKTVSSGTSTSNVLSVGGYLFSYAFSLFSPVHVGFNKFCYFC